MLKLRRNAADEPPSYIFHIIAVLVHREAKETALSFLRRLTPELYIVLNAVFVAVILDLRLR